MRFLCPNIDILGVNGFKHLPLLQKNVRRKLGWNKAYILSEWGPPGPWELKDTYWGAPMELSSSEKADYFDRYWDLIIADSTLCLGSYAFFWGKKYERTHTFFSLFPVENYDTESVNVLRNKWTGKTIGNKAPRIDSIVVNGTISDYNMYLIGDSLYKAAAFVWHLENDSLTYYWEIRPEGRSNNSPLNYSYTLNHLMLEDSLPSIHFRTPKEEGPYRIFSYVFDRNNNVATHNMPFYVIIK